MSAGCSHHAPSFEGLSAAYRRILWIVIAINATMFLVEIAAGVTARSEALKADALDFLGDSATYALTLWVIGQSPRRRASVALFKGLSLIVFALWVLGSTLYRAVVLGLPEPITMGTVGTLALVANLACALLLMRYRNGDANVRSVWLCSRNDAIGNIAVVLAASGVWASGTPWPDLLVAGLLASLFLYSAAVIVRLALAELKQIDTPLPEVR